MTEVLVVLNNYFNDFAVSLAFLAALVCLLASRRAGRSAADEGKNIALYVHERLEKVFYGACVFTVLGAVVRFLSLSGFEWADAERNGQITPLKVKYAMLLGLFIAGGIVWLAARKNVTKIKSELG